MDSKSNHNIDIIVASAVDNATRTGKPYEAIKTFDDACKHIGEDHQLVKAYRSIEDIDDASFKAFVQLRIIAEALNTFEKPGEHNYKPDFTLYLDYILDKMDYIEQLNCRMLRLDNHNTFYDVMGFDRARPAHHVFPEIPIALTLNSENLAKYCGKRFIGIWRDFYFTRLNNN